MKFNLITIKFNADDAIDDTMLAYISVTKVKQLITDILAPVMISAKKESQFARQMNMKLEEL